MATIQEAVANQTGGIGYNADAWAMTRLEPGMRIYKMMPSNGAYYFNYEGYREFSHTPAAMYGGLQVRVSKRFPMRVVVVEYEIVSAISVPTCRCEANNDYGCGGAVQYYIDDAQRRQALYQSSPGWGLDGRGIAWF